MTERTEASKSAILTAARGLGIDNDIAQYIASLIESDRGKQRSLKDTYFGNEEEGFLPNKTFQEEMNKYPQLWEVAQKIEGLACGCGSHAGGVIIVDEDITKTNSLIKINSGEWTTAWDLHESESAAGNVKIDLLATLNLTRIRTCLDLLVEHGYIEKGRTLRETYEKAIGIYNLERTAKEMWDMVAENKIVSLFQFETDVGRQGTTLAAPKSVADLCALNSIIRLMTTEKGGELPVEKFSRFKENHLLWEQEMNNFNLSESEKQIIRKHLTTSHGICECQESLMSLIQEPEIAGWNLKQADYLRKSIAKKDKKLYEQLTKEFYDNALEKKLSPTITRYFWEVLVKTQAGYSFCAAHCLAYSLIGLQNINLAYKYPIIFWNTANLIVDSSGVDEGEEDEEVEEHIESEDTESDEEVVDIFEEEDYENYEYVDSPDKKTKVKRARKATNYGKVASAIGKFMSRGISILPPDINNSGYTFSPNVETNSIVYGLRGITRVSNDIVKNIIANRPYSSLSDFLNKNHTNKLQTLNLIKSGAFDTIENKSREEIMNFYLDSISDKKNRLTLQNMQMLINYNLIPEEMNFYKRLFLFNKFLKSNKNGLYYDLNEAAIGFISKNFDFDLIDNGNQISQKIWDATYKKSMESMKNYLKENNSIILEKLNSALFNEVKEKYAVGGVSKWEMDSISFYYHDHELKNIKFPIVNFFDLPEEPQVDYSFYTKGGQEIKVFKLSFIAGTVIDKNKLKNSVTLLTKDGVVNVKIYKNQYSIFDKQISERGEDGKKHVIEAGWLKKGTLLLVQGIRRGQDFVPKKTKNSIYPIISKITDISPEGDIKLQLERVEVNNE